MLQAVVFDFDGVLANSEPLHLRAFQAALAEDGLALRAQEYYEQYLGYDDEGVFRRMAAANGAADREAWVARMVARKAAHMRALLDGGAPLFPDVEACVRALAARVPVGVASGAIRDEIVSVLTAAGLADAFTAIVAAGETPRSKPAPDPYRRAVELIASATGVPIDPRSVVAVEDSSQGLLAARAAGLRTVALTTTCRAFQPGLADLVLPGLGSVTFERLSALCARNGAS
ncbi:MAG TPA: HAD family phosphatase [Vicinamibacterales bacterium]|nr:HAD family phosphatase [Vicinamibacterales bacterium]